MNKPEKNRGFTLIELLMVISIIGLISGVVLSALGDARSRARNSQRIENIESIAKALQIVTTGTTNQFPPSGGQAAACLGHRPETTVMGCWGTDISALYNDYSTLTELVKTGMADGNIPFDPFFKYGQFGDVYTYTPDNGSNASVAPRGAYLYWIMEGVQQQGCGRGSVHPLLLMQNTTSYTGGTPSYGCRLYLGPYAPR